MPDRDKYPLLRYPGAKAKVAPLLSSLFPVEFDAYREVCAGSAALLAYVPRCVRRWINDIDPDITSVHKYVRDNPDAASEIRAMVKSLDTQDKRRAAFYEAKDKLTQGRDPLSYLLVDRLAEKAIVSRTRSRRGTRSWLANLDERYNWGPRCGLNALTPSRLAFWGETLEGVKTTTEDYAVPLCAPGENVFCVVDPPYLLGDHTRRLYEYDWSREDHRRLFELLRDCPHRFLLTLHRSPLTLRLYLRNDFRTPFRRQKGFRVRQRRYLYSLAHRRHETHVTELIIMNYDE
jgi:site-specific DNA-adenine methylase